MSNRFQICSFPVNHALVRLHRFSSFIHFHFLYLSFSSNRIESFGKKKMKYDFQSIFTTSNISEKNDSRWVKNESPLAKACCDIKLFFSKWLWTEFATIASNNLPTIEVKLIGR